MRRAPWLLGFLLATACAGAPGPRRLFPAGGDQFSLLDRGPPPQAPAAPPLSCAGKAAQRFECFTADLARRFDQAGISGALAVLDEDGSVHSAAHAAPGQPGLAPDARFAIASLSKTVLAVAALSLVDAGQLDLQKPVAEYLGELAGSPAGTVTVHQLLAHTAGLPDVLTPGACDPGTDLDTVLRRLKDRPLAAPAGAVHNYSNVGYAVVAAVLERVAGSRFEQLVTARVLVPAGMTTASYQADAPGTASATPASGATLAPMCRAFAPAGGLWASAPEMLRLLQVLLAGGGKVLRPESVMAMQRPHAPTGTGDHDAYGYGLGTTRYSGVTLLNHSGRSPQFAAAWALVPERHFAAVALVNTNQVPAATVARAAQVFLGLAAPSPQARPLADWSRYLGQYRDGVGALGSLTVALDGDQLQLRFLDREPVGGLPPQVTFLPGGVQARFVVTPIGVAERIP